MPVLFVHVTGEKEKSSKPPLCRNPRQPCGVHRQRPLTFLSATIVARNGRGCRHQMLGMACPENAIGAASRSAFCGSCELRSALDRTLSTAALTAPPLPP